MQVQVEQQHLLTNMSDIQKLADIQTAIDSLAEKEGSLDKIGLSSLDANTPSSINLVDVTKVADAQRTISGVMGSSVDLGAVTKIADCFKNLDDLLVERIKEKALETIEGTLNVSEMAQNLQKASKVQNVLQKQVDAVKELKEESLSDLLIKAKSAGFLDKVKIVKDITDKYSSVVGDINSLVSNIANLDICSQTNYNGSAAVPKASVPPEAAPVANPPAEPAATLNQGLIDIKRRHDDALFRINDVNDKGSLPDTPAVNSMMACLQKITRKYYDSVYNSQSNEDDDFLNQEFKNDAKNELEQYAPSWGATTTNEFNTRVSGVSNNIKNESDAIREYGKSKSTETLVGGLISTGVTVYGGPDWDFTTFLDIKKSQRPADLTRYWDNNSKYGVVGQEKRLNDRGIKTATLNYSDAYNGAYGSKLVNGKSCASTRFPGGSVIAIKNQDGSPYDPAGLNPQGLYSVDDTGNAELTYRKVDLFISREYVDTFKKSPMSSAQIFLVSLGTRKGSQFRLAQRKFGNTIG